MLRQTTDEKPYLSVCLVVRNEERTLEACLQSVRDRAPNAEIIVVDTCSRDKTPEIALKYADIYEVYKGPAGQWDEDTPWVSDMSVARQHSFELANGKWRMWIDGDDRLAGPEEAERVLKLNNRWQPAMPGSTIETGGANGTPVELTLEDTLKLLEEKHPDATCVWAPYLYQHDGKGLGDVWQDRERIVKWVDDETNEELFHWREQAHEILVVKNCNKLPKRVDFSTLVFVHEKIFDEANYKWSVNRHWDVLIKAYDAGEITTRRCYYLANCAKNMQENAHREKEFILKAHEVATTKHDRYTSNISMADFYADKGLFFDALEHYGAAQALYAELPDAWINGGITLINAKKIALGLEWMEIGLRCPPSPLTFINPRHFVVRFPTLMAAKYCELAEQQQRQGLQEAATANFLKAHDHALKVLHTPAIGGDDLEARGRHSHINNAKRGHEASMLICELWQYLVDNDDILKAVKLLDCIPNTILDHPIVMGIEEWSRKITKHVEDPQAYADFYASDKDSGFIATNRVHLHVDTTHPRVKWIVNEIKKHNPKARILEIGPCDGIIAIPTLREIPEASYLGLDYGPRQVGLLQEHFEFFGLTSRAEARVLDPNEEYPTGFDVVLLGEVIEHVPDPVETFNRLKKSLNPGGILVLTTPWGQIDEGHPPQKNGWGDPRDHRGHIRAMFPRDLILAFEDAGLEPAEITRVSSGCFMGDCMVASAQLAKTYEERPLALVAPASLWDWNSRIVHAQGIGASEELIINLAEALRGERKVSVYTQYTQQDVHKHVPFLPREHVRHLRGTDTKIVLSRAPGHVANLDIMTGGHDKVLWLQDTYYPELTQECADRFEAIVCVSEWHKQYTIETHKITGDNIHVLHNFILPEHFAQTVERKKDHFIYASSPDRGVVKLLKLWPRILAYFPDATLDIFYGWKGCQTLGANDNSGWAHRFESCRREYESLRFQRGITERGMVNHWQIAREFLRAGVWAYPTSFSETCCTNAIKARAAGCIPVTSALAALVETAECPQGYLISPSADDYDDLFIESVVKAVETSDEDRAIMSKAALAEYSVDALLPKWRKLLK